MLPTVTYFIRAYHGVSIESETTVTEASIQFIVQRENVPTTTNGDSEAIIRLSTALSSHQVFNVEFTNLINPQSREFYMRDMLTQIEIPSSTIEGLAQQISNYAAEQALLCQERGSQPLHIIIGFNVHYRIIEEETENTQTTLMDIAGEEGFSLVPASRSSIEALEIKKFDDTQESGTCMICLDEYVKGVDIAPLPCSHCFHSECIIKWLEQNNLCPLCRFTMPTED